MNFPMYLFSLREIHLDKNSFLQKYLFYIKVRLGCHVCYGRIETQMRLSAVWITCVKDRLPPSHSSPGKQRWFLSFWALPIEGRPLQWPVLRTLTVRQHLQEERILREEMCMTCYRGCDCWSLPSHLKSVCSRKEMNIELDFFQTPSTLDSESWGENNSEHQHLTLNHPDFLHQV